ncbi:MAG TPA: propionyl-CoA--succinate CoA transferase, partial [Corynebacterium sp.]|nr:propionyl-CoA--succinate CoA transferase [Corynebacterium sp.]
MSDRIANALLRGKVMSADEAAQFIDNGDKVGMSGFTGAAYPKALPTAIANRAKEAQAKGDTYKIDVYTGASTAPDCDGVMAEAGAINYRMPYQSDPIMRNAINSGEMKYQDIHLSHSGQYVEHGFYGQLDVAVVEATRITEEGHLI